MLLLNIFFYLKAGYLLTCYLFGLGDRHNDNIMISNEGIIFNIDYGFIMGNDPVKFGSIRLAPLVKWTSDIVSPILSNLELINKPFGDQNYMRLMEACYEGFCVLKSKLYFTLHYKF